MGNKKIAGVFVFLLAAGLVFPAMSWAEFDHVQINRKESTTVRSPIASAARGRSYWMDQMNYARSQSQAYKSAGTSVRSPRSNAQYTRPKEPSTFRKAVAYATLGAVPLSKKQAANYKANHNGKVPPYFFRPYGSTKATYGPTLSGAILSRFNKGKVSGAPTVARVNRRGTRSDLQKYFAGGKASSSNSGNKFTNLLRTQHMERIKKNGRVILPVDAVPLAIPGSKPRVTATDLLPSVIQTNKTANMAAPKAAITPKATPLGNSSYPHYVPEGLTPAQQVSQGYRAAPKAAQVTAKSGRLTVDQAKWVLNQADSSLKSMSRGLPNTNPLRSLSNNFSESLIKRGVSAPVTTPTAIDIPHYVPGEHSSLVKQPSQGYQAAPKAAAPSPTSSMEKPYSLNFGPQGRFGSTPDLAARVRANASTITTAPPVSRAKVAPAKVATATPAASGNYKGFWRAVNRIK